MDELREAEAIGTVPGKAGPAFSLGIATRGCHPWPLPHRHHLRKGREETLEKGTPGRPSQAEESGAQGCSSAPPSSGDPNSKRKHSFLFPWPSAQPLVPAAPALRLTLSTSPCILAPVWRDCLLKQPAEASLGGHQGAAGWKSRLSKQTGMPNTFSGLYATIWSPVPPSSSDLG